jgi:hypothetical protein
MVNMRPLALQFLTWGTAAAAVSSAVWLSSTNQRMLLCSLGPNASSYDLGLDEDLPATAAGHTDGSEPASAARVRETTIDQ